jgi:hypothetical protein
VAGDPRKRDLREYPAGWERSVRLKRKRTASRE